MKKNLWRRRFAATVAGGALAMNASSLFAVEMANITVENGAIPETNLPTVSIPTGQSTANFFVEAATGVGVYPVRIGNVSTDDFQNGIMLTSIRENQGKRSPSLPPAVWTSGWYLSNSVNLAQGLYSTAPVTNGTFQLIVDNVGRGQNGVGNANVAATYFPFSEGWVGGTSRSTSNTVHLGENSKFSDDFQWNADFGVWSGISTISNGLYRVRIPGVEDSRRQGLVFANHSKNEDNFASVAPAANGDGYHIGVHHGGGAGGFEGDPFAFVYVPFGTPGVTMASVHGSSIYDDRQIDSGSEMPVQPTVLNSSGSPFTVERAGVGLWRLTIPGQSPTTGTLLLNTGGAYSLTGGQSSSSQRLISYEADGNSWLIQSSTLGNAANPTATPPVPHVEPTAADIAADAGMAFQFAFMPFTGGPTGPGANPVVESFKDKVFGYNVNVVEYGGGLQNEIPGLGGNVPSGTEGYRFQFLRQNKGDYRVAVDGAFLASADGIMFGSVRQGKRISADNEAYGMIAAGDGGNGWEFATHIANFGLGEVSAVEMNVNYSAVFIGKNTGFKMAENAAQSGTEAERKVVVSIPGVNTLNDGVLVAQVNGNNDDYAVVTPAVDGSNWAVSTFDNNTNQSGMGVNWLYLPYTAGNLVAGRVAADGSVLKSTNPAGFTLTKDLSEAGTYLLTIPGKTPADGTLLLTSEVTAGLSDNVLVYESAGNAFKIRGVSLPHWTAGPGTSSILEDTNFMFAFIDHDLAPTLGGGGSFLAADFNQDGNVDGADLTAWKTNFGTGTTKAQGDANGDSKVDGADFLTWQQQFGQTPTAAAAAAAVPEPSSILLVGAAALGLGGIVRRRQS